MASGVALDTTPWISSHPRLVRWIAMAVCTVFLLAGGYILSLGVPMARHARVTTARIETVHRWYGPSSGQNPDPAEYCSATIRHVVDGTAYTGTVGGHSDALCASHRGDTIRVVYDLARPDHISNFDSGPLLFGVLAVGGALLGLVTMSGYGATVRRETDAVVVTRPEPHLSELAPPQPD